MSRKTKRNLNKSVDMSRKQRAIANRTVNKAAGFANRQEARSTIKARKNGVQS
jgi:hypothetical protein